MIRRAESLVTGNAGRLTLAQLDDLRVIDQDVTDEAHGTRYDRRSIEQLLRYEPDTAGQAAGAHQPRGGGVGQAHTGRAQGGAQRDAGPAGLRGAPAGPGRGHQGARGAAAGPEGVPRAGAAPLAPREGEAGRGARGVRRGDIPEAPAALRRSAAHADAEDPRPGAAGVQGAARPAAGGVRVGTYVRKLLYDCGRGARAWRHDDRAAPHQGGPVHRAGRPGHDARAGGRARAVERERGSRGAGGDDTARRGCAGGPEVGSDTRLGRQMPCATAPSSPYREYCRSPTA